MPIDPRLRAWLLLLGAAALGMMGAAGIGLLVWTLVAD